MRYATISLLLVFALSTESLAEMRTWTSRDGREIEAELMGLEFQGAKNRTVYLRRKDGRIFPLSPDKLSVTDLTFLRKEVGLAAVSDFASLTRRIRSKKTAEEIVALIEQFLALEPSNTRDFRQASRLLQAWQDRAKLREVRVGKEWITSEEYEKKTAAADLLIKEAIQLIQIGSVDPAIKKLTAASVEDPYAARAPFMLGLIHGTVKRNVNKAKGNFSASIRRLNEPRNEPSPANLAAALNNRAVTCVLQENYALAISDWQRCLKLVPSQPEIIQNLGRLAMLSDDRGSRIPDRVANLYTKANVSAERPFQRNVGWLYMHYFVDSQLTKLSAPGRRVEPRRTAFGTGFVIHPQHCLTNAHVVESAPTVDGRRGIQILDPARPGVMVPAELVAIDKGRDLALLRAKELTAAAIPLASKPAGRDCMIFCHQQLSSHLVHRNGRIIGIPGRAKAKRELRNDFLISATVSAGASGGPIVDESGQVFSVLRSGGIMHGGPVCVGVPARAAGEFVSPHLSGFALAKPPSTTPTWNQIAKTVSAATVRIVILQTTTNFGLPAPTSDKIRLWQQGNWRAYEDRTCPRCSGSGKARCRVPDCRRGWIHYSVYLSKVAANGDRYVEEVKRKKSCGTCRRGMVACPACRNGIDRSLK